MSNGFCKGSLLIILSALVIISGSFNASAQTVTATGTVVDSSTGEPLIGAVVLLKAKSSTDHVITDLDGRFSLRAPAGSVLEISLMGYVTLEVKAAASMGKIALVPDVHTLDEVQVIAYGKQSKLSITGAITSIGTSELLKSPAGSAASALAGAVTEFPPSRLPDSRVRMTLRFSCVEPVRCPTRLPALSFWWTESRGRFSRWTRMKSRVSQF